MENKLKEQLRFKMLGQLSDERTREDIDNAYDIAVDFAVSFSVFCAKIITQKWKVGLTLNFF